MKHIHKNKGFTLIELLVVISIIAVLSSVVLASLASAKEKARSSVIAQNLKTLQIAIEAYNASEGHYPYQNGDIPTAIQASGNFYYEIDVNGTAGTTDLADKLASSYPCNNDGSTCPAVIPDYVDVFPSSGIFSQVQYAVDTPGSSDVFDGYYNYDWLCGEGTAPMKGYFIMFADHTGTYDIPLPHVYNSSLGFSISDYYCLTGN